MDYLHIHQGRLQQCMHTNYLWESQYGNLGLFCIYDWAMTIQDNEREWSINNISADEGWHYNGLIQERRNASVSNGVTSFWH